MLFRSWEATEDVPSVAFIEGQWVVSDRTLIRQVLADPETYLPDNALDAVTPIPISALKILARHGFRLPPTLANNGSDTHPMLRAIVGQALHPNRVANQRGFLTGLVRRRITGLVNQIRQGQTVDLHARLSADLPLTVLAQLIELPDDDVKIVKEFSTAALELFWSPLSTQRQHVLAEIVGQYYARLRDFAAHAGGMVGQLRQYTQANDLGLSQVVGALFFLLVAGQETTSQFLTLLLTRLLTERQVLDQLVTGHVPPEAVVEEGLRTEPPIVTWRRVTAADAQLGSVLIPRGASVLLWLSRAGLKVAGEQFIPGQAGSRRHLAFGAGVHRCLGAQLARMESQILIAETAPLLRHCRLVRAPQFLDNLSFRMPDTLLVAAATQN